MSFFIDYKSRREITSLRSVSLAVPDIFSDVGTRPRLCRPRRFGVARCIPHRGRSPPHPSGRPKRKNQPLRLVFLFSLYRDSNPERARRVKKNSVGHCFLAMWCVDGYRKAKPLGRQAENTPRADLCSGQKFKTRYCKNR